MWDWTLNWGRVRHDLFVGSCPRRPSDVDAIRAGTGATALLSLQSDECRSALGIDLRLLRGHAQARGLAFTNAPMRDFDVDDQRLRLADGVRGLAALLNAGHTVYVHCTAGINRAPLTVVGYLTFVEGMAPEAALDLVRAGRPQADPYWEAWHGCRSDLLEHHRPAIAARAWALSREEPGAAPDDDWCRAEAAVIRDALIGRGGAG